MKYVRANLPAMLIFCLALIVRITYNLTVAHGYMPLFDSHYYRDIGLHLVDEHCFCLNPYQPATERAPLWPFIIAGIYWFLGPDTIFPRLFLSLLGSGTCVLVYLLARDLFGKRVALIIGIIAALYTGLFIYDGWLYTESLYVFLLMAFCYSLYRLQRTEKPVWMICSGIILALAALTRPNGLTLLALVGVWAIIAVRAKIISLKSALRGCLVIALVSVLIILPWTIRNYRETHHFIPIATGSGGLLAGVYNDTALQDNDFGKGMWISGPNIRPPVNYAGYSWSEDAEMAYVKHWISTHLSDMPELLSLHFINMWRPYTSEEGLPMIQFPSRISSRIVWDMMNVTPIPMYILAFLGLITTWKFWKKDLIIVYLLIAFTIIQNIIFYGSSRFRAPIEPLLVLLAGAGLWWLAHLVSGKVSLFLRRSTPELV